MELLQLRYFYESAKNENFTHTANAFCVPTTSVSASIKRLEKELGCELFDRAANHIRLNDNGRLLQQTLCSVFRDLDDVTAKLTSHDRDTREIRLLVRGMRRDITDLITEYTQKHAHVRFKTVFDYGETAIDDFTIIIDEENPAYAEYERIDLFTMQLALKCAADSPLCRRMLTLRELCAHPFVLMDAKGNMHNILEKACHRAGFSPNVAVLCNDIECYDKFIAAGTGIGIGRKAPDSNFDGVLDLTVTDFRESYTVCAYYAKKDYYGNVKSFVEFLKSKEI